MRRQMPERRLTRASKTVSPSAPYFFLYGKKKSSSNSKIVGWAYSPTITKNHTAALYKRENIKGEDMKVLLVNGSSHKQGCTYTALCEAAKTLNEEGIETEIFQRLLSIGIGHTDILNVDFHVFLSFFRRQAALRSLRFLPLFSFRISGE